MALARQRQVSLHIYPLGPVPDWIYGEDLHVFQTIGDPYSFLGQGRYFLSLSKLLARNLKGRGKELIHCIYPNTSLAASIRARRQVNAEIPILYDVRSPWVEMSQMRSYLAKALGPIYRSVLYGLERKLSKEVDGWSFITEELMEWYKRRIGLRDVQTWIFPSGVEIERFSSVSPLDLRSKYLLPADAKIIGYVGALTKPRRLDILIQALHRLSESDGDYFLLIVGDGDARSVLEREVTRLGLTRQVKFVGKVEPHDVPAYVAGLDVAVSHLPRSFVFESSFPLKLLEYCAAGVPVIASDVESQRLLAERLDLELYTWNSPHELARAVNRSLTRRSTVKPDLSEYSWDEIAKGFVSSYQSLT